MADAPKVAAYSPETARIIARYVRDALRQLGVPQNEIGGRLPSMRRGFVGVITNAGPDGQPDYDDERYWIKRSYIDDKDSETTADATATTHLTTSFVAEESDGEDDRIITATNLEEWNLDKEESGIAAREAGTHLLAKGAHVWVSWDMDRARQDRDSERRYFFERAPNRIGWAIPVSNAAAGKYNGKLLKPITTAPDASGVATAGDFGIASDTIDCLIINAAEIGFGTNSLTEVTPKPVFGTIGPRKSTEGKHVLYVRTDESEACEAP